MKLHFYILKGLYGSNPKLTYSECEVDEKPKTYKPISRFPDGYFSSFVKKEDVASLIGGNVVVLKMIRKQKKYLHIILIEPLILRKVK